MPLRRVSAQYLNCNFVLASLKIYTSFTYLRHSMLSKRVFERKVYSSCFASGYFASKLE